MKPLRLLLIFVGVIAATGAVLVGLALVPGIQRWAVLRAAQSVPGLDLKLATVRAGWGGVTLTGVTASPEGIPVTLERLEAEFSVPGLVLRRQLAIGRLQITGLTVDASQLSRTQTKAAAAGAPAAAPGLLAQVELPVDLILDNVRIEGRARLPGNIGQPPLATTFTLTGGGFSSTHEGLLQLEATLRNPAPEAKVSTLHVQAGLRAALTPRRTFGKVSLTTLVEAAGPSLAGPSQLKVGADLYQTSVGENYEVTVSTVLQDKAENIVIVRAQLPTGSRQYAGEWDFRVRTGQLEPFNLGGNLPDFAAHGSGRFAFDETQGNIALQGTLQGQVSRLEQFDPAWRTFGRLDLEADFDLAQQGGVLDLRRFRGAVGGASPVLAIQTLAPIRYDLGKRELLSAGGDSPALLRINVAGLPVDWVRPFVTAADVSGDLITGQIEVLRASASATDATVRGELAVAGLTVVRAGQPLLTKAAITTRVEATLAGGAITAPLIALTVQTPDGDALDLTGRLAVAAGAGAPLTLSGRFTAATPHLLETWLPGGPVTAAGDVDLTLGAEVAEIRPGRLEVRQGTGRALLAATLTQPFSVNLTTLALQPQDPAQPLARVELGRLPLAMLPLTQPGTKVGGYLQQGDFELQAAGGKVTLRALSPLLFSEVSLTQNRQPALTGLAMEARPVLEYSGPGNLLLQSGDVVIRASGRTELATLKVDVTQLPGQDTQAVMTFTLEVPALAAQPVFAGAQTVRAGRAVGEVRASVGSLSQLEARLTLNGLVAATTGQTMPVANIGFRGRIQPNGAVSLQVPLLLDNAGRRSDLNVALDLTPIGRGYSVDGRLTGTQVELEDLLGVMSVFMASAAPDSVDKPAAPVSVPADPIAAWARFSGTLGLDVKAVTRGKEWAMTGLTGSVAIEPTLVTLQQLTAAFGDTSRLQAKMELRFTGGGQPYRLTGDYALNDFDTGRLFRAIEPGKPPTVEGLFNINGKLAGNGETPMRALERITGDFQLTSRQGVFRGLQRTSNKVSMTSKAVELGASVLGSLFGSDKVTKTAEKVAGQAYFVDQLAQGIGEFNYDLLSVHLSRDGLLNMKLEDISLVSPEIRLQGRGTVSYAVGRPLLEQPLTATLTFAARGKIEQLFAKVHLLDGTKDELGYARTKEPVTLTGTLAKPDPTGFFTRIASAKIADYLDQGN